MKKQREEVQSVSFHELEAKEQRSVENIGLIDQENKGEVDQDIERVEGGSPYPPFYLSRQSSSFRSTPSSRQNQPPQQVTNSGSSEGRMITRS